MTRNVWTQLNSFLTTTVVGDGVTYSFRETSQNVVRIQPFSHPSFPTV